MERRWENFKFPGYSAVGSVPGLGPGGRVFESRCPDEIKHKFINFPKVRGIAQLVAFLVWDQAVACSSHAAPTTQGRLAQLVQSICLTSRGSAVRIRQRPRKEELKRNVSFLFFLSRNQCNCWDSFREIVINLFVRLLFNIVYEE